MAVLTGPEHVLQLARGNGQDMEPHPLLRLPAGGGRERPHHGIFVEGVDVIDHALTEERLRVEQEAGGVSTFEWYPSTGKLVVSDAYLRI